jgi:hypothetical protein
MQFFQFFETARNVFIYLLKNRIPWFKKGYLIM